MSVAAEKKKSQWDAFLAIWYNPEVTTIEEFMRRADEDPKVDFKLNPADKSQKQKLRQRCERYVLNLTSAERKLETSTPRINDPRYAKFHKRARKGSEPKWNVRELNSETVSGGTIFFDYTGDEFLQRNSAVQTVAADSWG
tara:strand:+ start:1734 stop:2156 length:423 start_codon:yes stop_codon:yes gene_type:complete